MKIKGRVLKGPNRKIVPILREDETHYIIVQGVTDMTPFEEMCPAPVAPTMVLPGNQTRLDTNDKGYKSEVDQWWTKRSAWIALKSMEASQIEWETVKMNDPSTFILWEKELRESGFSDSELMIVWNAIAAVNGLNEALIEEARKSFLTTEGNQPNGQNSHKDEVKTI